eukprot:TRINITY_DN11134_c0_g1_i1.p1 TRINITY_DN11134_c0_g1~~TRINITY_DN11134_c0_g1_i1.p1  ORF type:complete len:1504 (-),score=402.19 TRINITY_DN11134_c0_g1_i1:59-4570(-)
MKNYGDAGLSSYLGYLWVNPLVRTGAHRQVGLDDTSDLAKDEDSFRNTHRLLGNLERAEHARWTHPLLRAVCASFWPEILVTQVLTITSHFLDLISPLLMKELLVFQENQNAGNGPKTHDALMESTGLKAMMAIVWLGIFMVFWSSQVKFYRERVNIRISSALRGVVLLRTVRGGEPSSSAAASGSQPSAYNVLSFDVGPNIDIIWIVVGIWLFPIQFFSTTAVLFSQVQQAVVPGVTVIIVMKTINFILLYKDGVFRHSLLDAKDRRLSLCSEGFQNIRTLQMLTWVSPFERQIMGARAEELRYKNLRLWMVKLCAAMDNSLTPLVTLVTLAYFVKYEGGELKASTALPVIGLINSLAGPFGQFPTWMQQYLVWKSAYIRVNDFIGLRPCPPDATERHFFPVVASLGILCLSGIGALSVLKPVVAATMLACTIGLALLYYVFYAFFVSDQAASHGLLDDVARSYGSTTEATAALLPARAAGPSASANAATLSWEGRPVESSAAASAGASADDDAEAARTTALASEATCTFRLKELDMCVTQGGMVVLVAGEGQGKSSVLQALLGEMTLENGTLKSPALSRRRMEQQEGAGLKLIPKTLSAAEEEAARNTSALSSLAVPYAAQTAVLFTGTVRDNILFGSEYDARLYAKVVSACALETDFSQMPAGDATEVAHGGTTLSGGQRARIGLARAAYRAATSLKQRPQDPPLVLLDDPLCALDREVATEIVTALFAAPGSLLERCAVVVATADPWWLSLVAHRSLSKPPVHVYVLREGKTVAEGDIQELVARNRAASQRLPELDGLELLPDDAVQLSAVAEEDDSCNEGAVEIERPAPSSNNLALAGRPQDNPQENEMSEGGGAAKPWADFASKLSEPIKPSRVKGMEGKSMLNTLLKEAETETTALVKAEKREAGCVKAVTYSYYVESVGPRLLVVLIVALIGIMVFQDLADIWLAYWAEADKEKSWFHHWLLYFTAKPPTQPEELLHIYLAWVVLYSASCFTGHILEIVGGVRASTKIFTESLAGVLHRPFAWWDSNPTGRVLNRFSEDVEVMDNAITNIMGIIFGAVLYFLGRSFFLIIGNPISLGLLPFIGLGLEYYASFYRVTIRELQRLYLVCMGNVYQTMVEAIVGRVSVCAFASTPQVLTKSLLALEEFQRASFAKTSLQQWLGIRMQLIGFTISIFNTMYPLLQYFGVLPAQSAALVGFTIMYSTETVAILQQFIMNFSDLEMQLISVERLREYAKEGPVATAAIAPMATTPHPLLPRRAQDGLVISDVTVSYRAGIRPALSNLNLSFASGEVAAIVGRTGAGKSSLLLSVLQLVPYQGRMEVDGSLLSTIPPETVRKTFVGIVPQSPSIFSGSLRWNLDPVKEHSQASLLSALDAVGLGDLVASHPKFLDAIVSAEALGEEVRAQDKIPLSQGQKQLLCAARVLLRSPRVVLLDEVTSCLPAELASQALAGMLRHFKKQNSTVLLVTHQRALIPFCDRAVTINAGRVIEDRAVAASA